MVTHFYKLIFLSLLPVLLTACSQKESELYPEPGNGVSGKDTELSLRISVVGSRAQNDSEEIVKEKIRSLRIVVLSDGFIEYNALTDYTSTDPENGEPLAANFLQKFERSMVPGNKRIYLFANEESVGPVSFKDSSALPDGISDGMTLQAFLNHYTKDNLPAQGTNGYDNSGSGHEFMQLLSDACFTPDFSIRDNVIYLPYSAVYQDIKIDDDPEKVVERDMYVVPVATKFTFNLYNYRKERVELLEMNLAYFHSSSYVMANLDEKELNKPFNGKNYYWIDWMEQVAEASQTASDLESFNERAGWIENYSVPGAEAKVNVTPFVWEEWSVDRLTDKSNPEKITIVRYYPESKHIVKGSVYNQDTFQYEEVDMQSYSVNFKVIEEREGTIETESFESEFMDIDTVKSLFRGTHVIVDVDMYENMVEIFCKIEPWTFVPFQGYVQEEDD